MFTKILCPVDGSDHGLKAQELAISLAKSYDAGLVFQHVMLVTADRDEIERFARIEGLSSTVGTVLDSMRSVEGRLDYGYGDLPTGSRAYAEIGQHVLDDATEAAREAGVTRVETLLSDGDAADRILEAIGKKNADCVVMGSRGLSDMRAIFLGSVSHKVMNRAPCTCIAVK